MDAQPLTAGRGEELVSSGDLKGLTRGLDECESNGRAKRSLRGVRVLALPARSSRRGVSGLVALVMLIFAVPGAPAEAESRVVGTCDESSLRDALDGGGSTREVTFACDGTITLSRAIRISRTTTLDGANRNVTISGGDGTKIFIVDPALNWSIACAPQCNGLGGGLWLRNLTLTDGVADGPCTGSGVTRPWEAEECDGGAAIYIPAKAIVDLDHVSVTGSRISGHDSFNKGRHGSVYNRGTLRVANSTISDNVASDSRGYGAGSGIYNEAAVTIRNSTFSRNAAFTSGGAIYESGATTTLKVTDSTFADNTAGSLAGAIVAQGDLTVANSSFTRNGDVGAINSDGNAAVTNSTFVDNVGGGLNGGEVSNGTGGTMTITHSTFAHNQADDPRYWGGAIINYGALTLRSTILSGVDDECWSIGNKPIDGGFNLADDASCGFTHAQSRSGVDPRLDPAGLKSNGGPTDTIAIQSTSPALNRIPEGTNGCGTEVTTDQRGAPRPSRGRCDIGAYELNTAPTLAIGGGRCLTDELSALVKLSISDKETAAKDLTMWWNLRNPGAVRPENVALGGSGPSRSMTLDASTSGETVVEVNVSDGFNVTTLDVTAIVGLPFFSPSVDGTGGPDVLFSQTDDSDLDGRNGRDLLCGSSGGEGMVGGAGKDVLQGRGGNDAIDGGDAGDALFGGAGNDTLTGGPGADAFSGGTGTDTATDFNTAEGDTDDGTIP